jgi:Excalibur calcium-binding domain
MAEIKRFDKSHRTHWRSDDDLKRIHARLPWNQKRIRWTFVVLAFVGAAVLTQLGVWEYQRIEARHVALSEFPTDHQWGSCADVRAAGVAPLFNGDPGYNYVLDADRDGMACESYGGIGAPRLRWRMWQRFEGERRARSGKRRHRG